MEMQNKQDRYTIFLNEVVREISDKMAVVSEQQGDVKTHDHNFFELAYITGGSALHTINGEQARVGAGDYFLVDYGSVHSYTQSRDFVLINCLFMPEMIDDTLVDCRSVEALMQVCLTRYHKQYYGQTPANRIFHDEDGKIFRLLTDMQSEYNLKQTGYMEIFRCCMIEILILTMRKILSAQQALPGKNAQSGPVAELVRYLERNYKNRAVLGCFCRDYHYSQQYVSRLFREETGMTAMEFLHRTRIGHSCGLLSGSRLSIEEIARQVGYEDVRYYRQVFREMLHMSPRDYRKYNNLSGRIM